jgi:hypothetical protein
MAQINWLNKSSQDIKWVAFVNGQWEGNMVLPEQSYTMDDAGVQATGWSLSGFTGVTYSLLPGVVPSGFSVFNVAVDNLDEGEKPLTELPEAE